MEYIRLVNGDVLAIFAKLRVKPYSENEALKQAQQRYYQKNKEEKLRHNQEDHKTWLASQDVDELQATQRESRSKYYNKKKELKQQKRQEELTSNTDDDNKVAIHMGLFNKIF